MPHAAMRPFWMSASSTDVQEQIDTLVGAGGGVVQAGVPLQLAISLGKPESIQALISAAADVNLAPASSNIPPLSQVINQPIPALVPLFLEAGAEVGAVDSHGNAALHYAAASLQQPQTLSRLIAAGADVNAQNAAEDTALHVLADIAARTEESYTIIANIAILKNAGANLDIQNNKGETPLHMATTPRWSPGFLPRVAMALS
jgi:ankyrin repeat protein